jgi:hypothetical protein
MSFGSQSMVTQWLLGHSVGNLERSFNSQLVVIWSFGWNSGGFLGGNVFF